MANDLPPHIDEYKRAVDAPILVPREPTPRYSSSSFGFCDRKTYFKKLGTPSIHRLTFEAECRMAIGNTVHDIIEKRLQRKYGARCVSEIEDISLFVTLDGVELEISTKPDAIIFTDTPETDFIAEVKTGRKVIHTKAVDVGYQMQLACYKKKFGVSLGIFHLVDRDVFSQTIRLVDEKKAWKMVLDKLAYLEDCIAKGEPPPIGADKSKYACRKGICCEYADLCYGEQYAP